VAEGTGLLNRHRVTLIASSNLALSAKHSNPLTFEGICFIGVIRISINKSGKVMNIEELRSYCLSKPHATEDLPFDEFTLAFRVGGKIFALTSLDNTPLTVNLKCDPERAVELRERYEAITGGFHMNKKHWNTITFDGSLERSLICEMIDHSYNIVLNSLPKSQRLNLV
jgi:predicted DNA-binding protein (MmcQ/YjbR family)